MKYSLLCLVISLISIRLGFAQAEKIKEIDGGGSGPFPAKAFSERAMKDFVVYRPEDLAAAIEKEGKLPLVVWANGGCMNSSIHHERLLTEVASHGYVIVAIGTLQMTIEERIHEHTPDKELRRAIDKVIELSQQSDSEYYNVLDTNKIVAAGQSCGGAQVISIADDPRVKSYMMFNSGMGDMTMAGASKESLNFLHGEIIYIVGGESDVATENALMDYERIDQVPVVLANLLEGGHGGTFNQEYGGSFARIALDWLNWQFKEEDHSALFLEYELDNYPGWEVKSKNFKL
ncbi:alpha/beta hydrolase [Echinicola salinicaeni]|uniref:poly(ethylene terephthalate) hydrolase family protein n=1 Tax=Echinicola salinicaeni TaxID=2762757 RepID=UPI0016477FFB|nr:alpha/beta hydrolase [Echinicola salinicaeni]